MFIPLVDTLRCVHSHADTWLVASIDSAVERDIRRGTLGCPLCNAEYPVRDGVVLFSERVTRSTFIAPNEDDAVRLAAALDLTDARMTAVLHGRWGAHAPLVRGISPAQLLLVNPPDGVASGDGISIVLSEVAPLARASAAAVAMDVPATAAMASSLVASVSGGARLLAPAATAIPPGFTELVRDDDVWVARLDPSAVSSAPIGITRRAR